MTRWGGYTVVLEKSEHPVSGENALVLDADKIPGGLTLGPCRPGDGLYLPEGRGRRSVKRLCLDRGLDPVAEGWRRCGRWAQIGNFCPGRPEA